MVVDNVSFSVGSREIVGLLGPNGAGKTTSFYMVVGLIKPDKGKVFINGEEITAMAMYQRARKGISYLPQEPSIFRKLSVEENIKGILETMSLGKGEITKRTDKLLEDLGIAHLRKEKAFKLSGGERRRVEISRALASEPQFMLLDEPFAGIDPIAVTDIQKIIKGLSKKGIGVLITDHNVRETLKICHRAYILTEGKIMREGTPDILADDEMVRKHYLGDEFRLN